MIDILKVADVMIKDCPWAKAYITYKKLGVELGWEYIHGDDRFSFDVIIPHIVIRDSEFDVISAEAEKGSKEFVLCVAQALSVGNSTGA